MLKRITICLLTLLPLLVVVAVAADFSPSHSDEFDDGASFAEWMTLDSNATTATTIDINSSEPNKLVIVPTEFNQNGWYAGSIGPYIYRLVEGDFVATSHIIARHVNDPNAPPTGEYNSAGFVVRDPAGDTQSAQNWIMYNHGAQIYNDGAGHHLATEAKTTVNSTSVLTLRPTASNQSNSGRLTVCRSGTTFYLFKWMDDESGWQLEETLHRPDLPATLQVGLAGNGWTGANLRAEFDYMRVYTGAVATSADCLTRLSTPTNVTVVQNLAETPPSLFWLLPLIAFALTIGAIINDKRITRAC